MPYILMSSEEFGEEKFVYDTLEEAKEGFERLKKKAEEHAASDGVERMIMLVLDDYTTTSHLNDEERRAREADAEDYHE